MNFPLWVTVNNLPNTPVLEKALREKFDTLSAYCAQIQGCLIEVDVSLQTHF
jgi:hypothetical protein